MVSVIIPCYNCASFIERAVNSVFAQTYKQVEIILVDNNSTDNTMQVLTQYQDKYPDQVFVYQERKKGAPAARNNGLYKAKGEWIQFLDADDELLPEKIEQQLLIAQNTGADVIAGDCILEYTNGDSKNTIIRHTNKDIWKGLITSNLGITSSNLWRKAPLLQVNGWDENLTSSQEYDLLFRLLKFKARISVDKALNTIVHFSGNSVSKSSNAERFKQIISNRITLRLKIKNELRYRNLLTSDLNRAIDTYIYTEIMSNYEKFPEYANSLLQQHHLEIGFLNTLRIKTKHFLKGLKSLNKPSLNKASN